MKTITLGPGDIADAKETADLRNRTAISSGRKPVAGVSGDQLEINILGCLTECAFARAMGWPWDRSVNTFQQADVHGYHVRGTSLDDGGLLVRPHDALGIYVLVTGQEPTFTVRGWAQATDVRKRQWWRPRLANRPGVFLMEQGAILPLSTLPPTNHCRHCQRSPLWA